MPRLSHEAYLVEVERLAKVVIQAVCDEGKFEPFSGDRATTLLEVALVELARALRYPHLEGDGCEDHEP